MKNVSLRLILKYKGGKQHCLPFCWLGIFLKKREHQKKGALNQKIEDSLYTLYWGFKKILFIIYTYDLAQILQNGAKFIQKLTPNFKNHMRNLDNFRQAVGCAKS